MKKQAKRGRVVARCWVVRESRCKLPFYAGPEDRHVMDASQAIEFGTAKEAHAEAKRRDKLDRMLGEGMPDTWPWRAFRRGKRGGK